MTWQARLGRARLGTAWSGWVWQARCGSARHGRAWCVSARLGAAWQAWPGTARHVVVRSGAAGRGRAVWARLGEVRLGMSWRGWAGAVSHGLAPHGCGLVRLGDKGPEAVLPLGNSPRLRDLLADPRFQPGDPS